MSLIQFIYLKVANAISKIFSLIEKNRKKSQKVRLETALAMAWFWDTGSLESFSIICQKIL